MMLYYFALYPFWYYTNAFMMKKIQFYDKTINSDLYCKLYHKINHTKHDIEIN